MRPYFGYITLDAGAQFEVTAQGAYLFGDACNFFRNGLAPVSCPLDVVEVAAAVGEGVNGRLQGVVLHGELVGGVNVVLVEIGKLLLVAVKLNEILPHNKGRPFNWTAFPYGSQ